MGQAVNADPLTDSVNPPGSHIQAEKMPKNEATLIIHTNANIPKSSLSVYCRVQHKTIILDGFATCCIHIGQDNAHVRWHSAFGTQSVKPENTLR